MRSFDEIVSLAAEHHGGRAEALAAAHNSHLSADLSAVNDDRYLAEMSRAVFNAGFSWKVIARKWQGFEAAFAGFDPHRVAFIADDALHALLADTRIVRNGQKIRATIENARMVVETARQYGSFGAFLQAWPDTDQAGLLAYLNKHGHRLGGASGQYFLRFSGYDAWITSADVCAALLREGVLETPKATSKSALGKVDAAITHWHEQSGYPRSVISRLLALSVG